MRTIPLLLLAGCQWASFSGTTPTGTPSGAPTGTTAGSTSGPTELCTDGIDNDGDGLLDCEDDDCATTPACFESDCEDGIDNDADGLFDCADEDCWTVGTCQVTEATLTSASSGSLAWGVDQQWCQCTGCSYFVTTSTRQIGIESPQGTVRVRPPSQSTWTTCSWSADRSFVDVDQWQGQYFGQPFPVIRSGFAIDSGCPIQTSGRLPAWWVVSPVGSSTSALTIAAGPIPGGGTLWGSLPLTSPIVVQSSVSFHTVPWSVSWSSGNCYSAYRDSTGSWRLSGAQGGDPYEAGP